MHLEQTFLFSPTLMSTQLENLITEKQIFIIYPLLETLIVVLNWIDQDLFMMYLGHQTRRNLLLFMAQCHQKQRFLIIGLLQFMNLAVLLETLSNIHPLVDSFSLPDLEI